MHDFQKDFYGHELKAIVLGYIRPELDYVSRGEIRMYHSVPYSYNLTPLEALIEDIETDKRVALNCLARPGYEKFKQHSIFTDHPKL